MNTGEIILDYPEPFWAAYRALGASGILLAGIRQEVAADVLRVLLRLRYHHGTGYMLQLAQCRPDDRQHLVNEINALQPEEWTSVTRAGIDAAVVAAADYLAKD